MKQPTLTIVRGLPGSGKSTLAKKLAQADGAYHLEADMYFVDAMGNYAFDKAKLSSAHAWCRDSVEAELKAGSDVYVSNTFTTQKEMNPYLDMARELGAKVQVILCQGEFGSIHDVPEETMQAMRNRFRYDVNLRAQKM